MAKYTVLMSCGHEDTVELFGKNSERERKIAYFEANGLCKECYKKKMQDQIEAEGFHFNASVLPLIDENDGEILLFVWFSGNTKPYREEIKGLGGYRWTEKQIDDNFSFRKPSMCWNKTIKLKDLQDEITKAVSIGADSVVSDRGLFAMINYQIAVDKQNEWKKIKSQVSAIEKPSAPVVLKGHKWNQKIYGRAGNYSIYPDGEKVSITDEEAEEIKAYLLAKEEYNKKIEGLKNAQES